MANKKYTELPQANAITGAEILAMVQDGGSVQGDIDLIKAYFDTLYAPALTSWVVRWDTFAGVGSTDTKIIYFTNKNTDTSAGNLTIVNNSTNGLRLTIVSNGLYAISHSLAAWGASLVIGVSHNSSQLTTNVDSITAANRMAIATLNADYAQTVSFTMPLSAGDIIRPHLGSGAGNAGTYAAIGSFSITRIL